MTKQKLIILITCLLTVTSGILFLTSDRIVYMVLTIILFSAFLIFGYLLYRKICKYVCELESSFVGFIKQFYD
jgi:hypothetical protein